MFGALTKVILREAMKEYLPLEVYKRTDKIGFASPIEKRIFHISSKSHKTIQEYIKNSEFMKMDFLRLLKSMNPGGGNPTVNPITSLWHIKRGLTWKHWYSSVSLPSWHGAYFQ